MLFLEQYHLIEVSSFKIDGVSFWVSVRGGCLLSYYLVLLGFTGFYRVTTKFNWVLLGFSELLPSFIGFYWVLLGFTGFY